MFYSDGNKSGTSATQPQHDGFRPRWRHAGVTVVLEALDIIRPFVGQYLELQVLAFQSVIDQGNDGAIGNQAQAALERGQQLLHTMWSPLWSVFWLLQRGSASPRAGSG